MTTHSCAGSCPLSFFKKHMPLLITLAVGFGIWFAPHPEGISENGWHLLAIFIATIVAIITKPLPMGAVALIALALTTVTGTLNINQALVSYNKAPIWLIVFAFFISKGFMKTQLGTRIAYYSIRLFGKSTLGLAYSVTFSELLLSPAIPSVTARTGGILYPIINALSLAFNSKPNDPSSRNLGTYLILVCFQASVISSAMFLTAMAANPIVVALAADLNIPISWWTWAKAAFVPGILAILVMPLLVFKLSPPKIKDIAHARELAHAKLKEMGAPSRHELIMLGVFFMLIFLWIFGENWGIDSVTTAILGISILLLTEVLDWKELLSESAAWETLVWFGALLTIASHLNNSGVISYFTTLMAGSVQGMPWIYALLILSTIYFFTHYFFASSMAHVGAMFTGFVSLSILLGTPPLLAGLLFAFYSSLYGGLTHYGIGSAPVLFGSGFVSTKEWWRVGFVVAIVNIIIFLGVGGLWWKFLAIW